MLWGEAVLVNGCEMGFGAVADVLVKMIVWVLGGEVDHIVITGDFGDDRGGGDFAYLGIGFDVSGRVFFEGSVSQKINFAIDNNLGKRRVKSLNRLHGSTGGETKGF